MRMRCFATAVLAVWSMLPALVVPALSQEKEECVELPTGQICGFTKPQIDSLHNKLLEFDKQNKEVVRPQSIPSTQLACVRVDNFPPVCGLTPQQLAEIASQAQILKQ
jgi:hypothetical protein